MPWRGLPAEAAAARAAWAAAATQVVVLSTTLMAVTRLNEDANGGIEVVGYINPGFPPMYTDFAMDKLGTLLSSAVVISFVGFMESIAIAKSLAAKNKYELDANQVRG
jgi:SulP family sulfate permease